MSAEFVGLERVSVRGAPGAGEWSYEIHIGSGLVGSLGELLHAHAPAHRYIVIADANVATAHGERVVQAIRSSGTRADLLEFPPGEASKSRATWADLTDRMLGLGVARDAVVVALGGGVTGDLAGFVAATYMRGLPLVQVPTSLLAMIDSSIGGKTGIDVPAGKNLVGAFLQPRVVVADVDTLRTLPPAELRSGMAEAIKHAAIADAEYFRWIESSFADIYALEPPAVASLISTSVRLKAGVVGRDEKEGGPRKMLNFGHTIGHSVESLSRYRLAHGAAVAIGMVIEAEAGERIGVTERGSADRLRVALTAAELPISIPPEYTLQEILEGTLGDKKARAGKVEYALLRRIGEAGWGDTVPDDVMLEALAVCR